jgi:hypothetical protein
MTIERRLHKRMHVNHPMVYIAMDEKGIIREQGVGLAMDVSANGLMLETKEPIREKKLSLRLSIPGDESIAVDGLLVYSMPYRPETYRSGISFDSPGEALSDFMAALEKQGRCT